MKETSNAKEEVMRNMEQIEQVEQGGKIISRKKQNNLDAFKAARRTWEINPQQRIVPGKAYKREKVDWRNMVED